MCVNTGSKRLFHFLSITVLGVWCVSCLSELQAANDTNRPNFLYIQTDQYRYDLLQSVQEEMPRYAGKTHIRTPNLDRLRSEGVYFRRAYTQCAVCGPARSTFRTGNTIERHGQQSNDLYKESIYNLNTQFKNKIEANVTFDQILAERNGCVVEHFGKWHMPRIYNLAQDKVTPIMHYNDATFTGMTNDTDYAHLVYSFYNSDSSFRYDDRLAEVSGGLSTTESWGMQRDTYSHFPYVTDAIDVRYGLAPYTANNPATGLPVSQPDQQGRATLPANRSSSYFEGTAAVGALDRLARGTEPFVLTASFHNPHAPMVAPGLYYDYYKALEDDMLLPDSLSGADMVNSAWSKQSDPDYQDPVKVKEWMVSYYALCEEVDHYVGLLLDKLDEYNIADNTLVVFVADHGEALGSHGTREKSTFLEESAHIPLLMRFPGRIDAGTVVEESVTTIDCVATLLDYMGAGQYDVSDGRSLRRFIEKTNYNETFDDEAIITEWDFRTPTGPTALDRSLGGESNFMCKKGQWKLILTKKASSSRLDMMYNIETDPYEMVNYVGNNGMTASDAAVGKAEHLKCLLIEWMQRMDGGTNKYYSDPKWNAGEGMGDIAEITARRKWKTLNIWVSDTAVEVGLPVDVAGQLTRNEYIYLGRTTAGTLTVSSVTVQGADAGLFQLSEFTSGSITQGNYGRVKLTYRPTYYGQPVNDARIVISHSAGADKVIELSAATPPNSHPVITSTPGTTVDIGNAYSYTLTATDPETNALSYSSVTLPAWLNFNTNTAVLSGTPSTNNLGANPVTLRVSDLYGHTDQRFTVWVGTAGNDIPVITSSPDTGVIENQPYSYVVSAVDIDGDTLTFAAPTKPAWLSFNSTNHVLSGTPASTNIGLHFVSLTVSDGAVTVTQQFNIAVFETPTPVNLLTNPSFETGNGTGWLLTEMTVTNAQASDGTYSLYIYGTGADIVRGNSRPASDLSIQPNTDYVVTYDVNYVSGTGSCTIRLTTIDRLKSTTSGTTSGWLPKTLSFNSGTNTTLRMELYCDGTPSADFVAYLDNFVIAQAGAVGNTAPVITSVPATNITAGSAYRYTLTAADAEEDALTFTEVSIPSWCSFNTNSGVLSGTPLSGDAGSHGVTLQVSDGDLTDQQSFSIEVVRAGSGYDAWSAAQSEPIGAPDVDYDGDGRNNLYEYALNGDPTDDQDCGVDPVLVKNGDGFDYMHLQRNDDFNTINYSVETRTNLLSGDWTTDGSSVTGTNAYNESYDVITHRIETTNEKSYIRLKIEHR